MMWKRQKNREVAKSEKKREKKSVTEKLCTRFLGQGKEAQQGVKPESSPGDELPQL